VLRVKVERRGFPFDQAKLRASLSQELGREVVLVEGPGSSDVYVELDSAAHADVAFSSPDGQQLRRGVELPPDPERSVQVVSWLVVNLVRDEASELLNELRARRKDEAEARAVAEQAEKAAVEKAAREQTAAEKAAADKASAEKAAAAEAARQRAEREAKPGDLLRDPLRSLDAAVATPLSFLRDSPKRELHLQLALLYGESGAIRGVAVTPGALRIRRDLLGIAVGAGAVLVGGKAQGALVSAGGVIAGDVTGVLVGAGFASAKSLQGVAASAGVTVVRGPSRGLLLGVGANFSPAHRGVEVSAGVNTARDLQGLAVAPLNVHRRVKGLQVGIVNVAEEVDGAAIGVISIAKNGRVQPVLWTDIGGALHLAIKSVVGYVFTEIGSGIDLNDDELSYDGGIGAHLALGKGFFLEPSVHYSASHKTADASGAPDEHQLHYLAQVGWRAGDKLDLLAGAGLRQTVVGGAGAAVGPEARAGIAFF